MLFPGGAREALHGKGEEYKLFWYDTFNIFLLNIWNTNQPDNSFHGLAIISFLITSNHVCFRPEKTDFVRMAGMFDAIIIPFSSVGIAESVNIFFDKEGM